jgi:ABC-2 type transport system permease protein
MIRLTLVELRKLADTRAGLWLLILVGLGSAGTAAIMLGWSPDEELRFADFFGFGLLPPTVLLPVLGILSMTGEWSQRTALTTFALVPARWRVITAKVAAGVLISAAATAATMLLSAAANLIGTATGGDGSWHIDSSLLWQGLLTEVLFVLMGMGFGAALLSSPLAIVAYFALPTLWGILAETIRPLRAAGRWLNVGITSEPLSVPSMTASQYGHLAVSALAWIALPLALGVWRMSRKEVS